MTKIHSYLKEGHGSYLGQGWWLGSKFQMIITREQGTYSPPNILVEYLVAKLLHRLRLLGKESGHRWTLLFSDLNLHVKVTNTSPMAFPASTRASENRLNSWLLFPSTLPLVTLCHHFPGELLPSQISTHVQCFFGVVCFGWIHYHVVKAN